MRLYPWYKRKGEDFSTIKVRTVDYAEDGTPIKDEIIEMPMWEFFHIKVYEIWTWDGMSYDRTGRRKFRYRETVRTNEQPREIKKLYKRVEEYMNKEHGYKIDKEISIRRK